MRRRMLARISPLSLLKRLKRRFGMVFLSALLALFVRLAGRIGEPLGETATAEAGIIPRERIEVKSEAVQMHKGWAVPSSAFIVSPVVGSLARLPPCSG